jgi:hypothetical protein
MSSQARIFSSPASWTSIRAAHGSGRTGGEKAVAREAVVCKAESAEVCVAFVIGDRLSSNCRCRPLHAPNAASILAFDRLLRVPLAGCGGSAVSLQLVRSAVFGTIGSVCCRIAQIPDRLDPRQGCCRAPVF